MITAIVLIKTSVDRIPEIAESIAALENVSEVYSVTGTYDLIALVRVARHENLADIIPGRISKIPGVEAEGPRRTRRDPGRLAVTCPHAPSRGDPRAGPRPTPPSPAGD